MRPFLSFLCLTSLLLPSMAVAGTLFPDMKAAKQALKAGDYQIAAENWGPLAEFGIPQAQLEMGNLYTKGKGVEQDHAKAFSLFSSAADNGLPRAYMELGRLYQDGNGVPQDIKKAEQYYKRAAVAGYTRSNYYLGRLYEQNPSLISGGRKPLQLVGHDEKYYLAQMKAGKLAYAEQIGHMYEYGQGVPKNLSKALMYMIIAKRAGSTNAALRADKLKSQVSLEEYLKAQRKAEDMIVFVRAKEFYDPGLKGKRENQQRRNVDRQAFFDKLEKELEDIPLILEDPRHYLKAAQSYREAINKGYLRAAKNLGMLYETGKGVTRDPAQALAYYYVAQGAGVSKMQPRIERTQALLSPEQITQARAQADSITTQNAAKAPVKKKPYRFVGSIKSQYIAEENQDLGTRSNQMETALVLDTKAGVYFYPTDKITSFIEGRALKNFGLVTADTDNGEDSFDNSFVELRQAWVEFDELFGNPRLSFKAGRQRFREDRALWWSRDFDALRLALDSTLTTGFIAVGQNLDNYRLGDNDDFTQDQQDRLRVLGEITHRLSLNHDLEGRFLYENDYSGAESVGSLVSSTDRDREDAQLLWAGVRAKGKMPGRKNAALERFTYRADAIVVGGEETLIDTASTANARLRSVTAARDRDVFGYAFDGAMDFSLGAPLSPTLTLGYAFGSGDDDAGGTSTDNAFRQSDLEGNTSLFPNGKATSTLRNYGEVLRPELSNLHILTSGVNVPLFSASDLSLNYFSYWLSEDATSLRSSGISAPLNGRDKHIGQALDLAANINIGREFDTNNKLLSNVSSRFRAGAFKAGDAYGSEDGEYAFRGSAEFRLRF